MKSVMSIPGIERRIAGLRAEIRETERLLPYADGPAYGQDRARIGRMRREIARLEARRERA